MNTKTLITWCSEKIIHQHNSMSPRKSIVTFNGLLVRFTWWIFVTHFCQFSYGECIADKLFQIELISCLQIFAGIKVGDWKIVFFWFQCLSRRISSANVEFENFRIYRYTWEYYTTTCQLIVSQAIRSIYYSSSPVIVATGKISIASTWIQK